MTSRVLQEFSKNSANLKTTVKNNLTNQVRIVILFARSFFIRSSSSSTSHFPAFPKKDQSSKKRSRCSFCVWRSSCLSLFLLSPMRGHNNYNKERTLFIQQRVHTIFFVFVVVAVLTLTLRQKPNPWHATGSNNPGVEEYSCLMTFT